MLFALQAILQRPPVRVAIVPSSSNEFGKVITTSPKSPDAFYVVLTNISGQPTRIFEGWNSWGYQSLSFELQLPDGSIHRLRKREQFFTRNGPSTFEIPPGEPMVIPIRLDDSWENLPVLRRADDSCLPGDGGEAPIRLRAIYQVDSTSEALKQHVWVGSVMSPSYELTLRWWRHGRR